MPVIAGRLVALLVVLLMAGSASTLPPRTGQEPSHALVAPTGTPLDDVGVQLGLDAGTTAAWPLPEGAFALDARLASIARATTSVDAQTYLVADDLTSVRSISTAARRPSTPRSACESRAPRSRR